MITLSPAQLQEMLYQAYTEGFMDSRLRAHQNAKAPEWKCLAHDWNTSLTHERVKEMTRGIA